MLARCLEQARALSAVHAILGRSSRIRADLRPEPVGAVPYQDGYRAAKTLRRLLDNPTQPILDIGALFGEELDTLVAVVRLRTQRVEAVTVKDRVTTRRSSSSTRAAVIPSAFRWVAG